MSAAPLVSVILPVRDAGQWLAASVRSILEQSVEDLELIVIDDGSSDDAVNNLCRTDSRLLIARSGGRGVVAAHNHGLQMSRGRYVARMDADDISLPNRLAEQLDVLRSGEAELVGARVEVFRDDGEVGEGFQLYEQWLNGLIEHDEIERNLFVESPLPNPTLIMERRHWQASGGYRDGLFPEDYDLLLRAWRSGLRMAKPEPVLLRWRDSDSRLTRTDPRYAQRRFLAAKAHHLVQHRFADRPVVIWGAGRDGRRLAQLWLDEGGAVHAFLDVDPKKVGRTVVGVPVLDFERRQVLSELPLLVCVGARGAREEIRNALNADGRIEGQDYFCLL